MSSTRYGVIGFQSWVSYKGGADLFTHVCSGERVAGRHGVFCPRKHDIPRSAHVEDSSPPPMKSIYRMDRMTSVSRMYPSIPMLPTDAENVSTLRPIVDTAVSGHSIYSQ